MALLVLSLQRSLRFHLTSEGILLHCRSVELIFLALPPPFLAQEAVFCVQMERKVKFQNAGFKEEKLSSLMLKIWLIQHHGKGVMLDQSAVYRRQPEGPSSRVGRPLVARENWYNSSTTPSVPQTLCHSTTSFIPEEAGTSATQLPPSVCELGKELPVLGRGLEMLGCEHLHYQLPAQVCCCRRHCRT